MTINNVLSHLHLDQVIEDAVKEKLCKKSEWIKTIAETAYCSDDFNYPLLKRMPFTRLVAVIFLLTQKYDDYRTAGVADEIIWNTFQDVSLRANDYFHQNGKIGLSKDDVIWFRHIMNVDIFKIGALQFQKFKMIYLDEETIGEPYMTFTNEQKNSLPSDSPVINCHIQKGANIDLRFVKESLNQAKIFFEERFPEVQYQAFLCYSWMLYPPMIEKLPENSNIKRFSSLFSIIGACSDSAQAEENLFSDKKYQSNAKLSSLQRLYKEHQELFGFGCGIIRI